jgi:hypothetical protein
MKSGSIKIMSVLGMGMFALSVASSRGQNLNLTGTFAGSLTDQTLINSGTSANDGLVSSWVVSSPSVNSGGYIFIYQLENEGPDTITGVNFNSYAGINVMSAEVFSNVYVNASSLPGELPTAGVFGPTISFDTVTAGGAATFNGNLNMGGTSWFLVLETGSTSLNTGYALTQDDFQAHGAIYAPNFAVFPVPEPSSAALMLLVGSACFYAVLRWRRAIDG